MKKIALIIPCLFLAGCSTLIPVNRKFPEAPKELMVACPDLKKAPETSKLSEVLKVVTQNYGQYNECRAKSDAWIEWYNAQKDIFESVK